MDKRTLESRFGDPSPPLVKFVKGQPRNRISDIQ